MNEDTSSLDSAVPSLKGQVFPSISRCAAITGFSKQVIKQAKRLGAPGFTQNGRIKWDELEPYLKAHQGLIQGEAQDTLEYYKKENEKRRVEINDLTIKKMKAEMLDPKDVQKFIQELATIVGSVLKQKEHELTSKCTGYEKLVGEEFTSIYKLIQEHVQSWVVSK